MKVLICALNTKYVHSSLAPWYLKAAVEKYSSNSVCDVYESTINEDEEKIIKHLLEAEADMIGFSAYIWNIGKLISISKRIKKQKKVKIFFGGPEVSYNAKEVLEKNPHIDFIISGEGEEPLAKVCDNVSYRDIEGLCYRDGDNVMEKEPYISKKDPPCPYTEEYFKALNGRISYIETSRGCPYRCAFCLSGRCGGVRFFDIEEAKRNILLLANSGSKTVKFIDRTFNADKKRAKEILSFIIDNYGKNIPGSVCFHFEIEGEIIDDETVEILSKAPVGSIQVEIGLQSFNEKTLNHINRKTNLAKLTENIKKLVSLENIHIHVDLIAGLPYEDIVSFGESFNKALALNPHMLQFGFLKLLHGADMREDKERYCCEYSKEPPYEVLSTPHLTNDDLNTMHLIEDVFDKIYNSGRFVRTAKYIAQKSEDPFKTYTGFAEFMKNHKNDTSLDAFTLCMLEYFSTLDFLSSDILRDCMALDRLSSNRMGMLPEFLKYRGADIKKALSFLESNESTKRRQGIKRAATFLKTENVFAYVDYDCKNPVTDQYEIKYLRENNIF
ncbi:MAG: DUF4080 domain-containing protein [Clostridia bacterium]|nr:DUF4080 domain-containing protein [Clostridia bacterium]